MLARKCTFKDLFRIAPLSEEKCLILSFVQVEYGITELQGHWDGFIQASDSFGIEFETKRHAVAEFLEVLSSFYDLEHEPIPADEQVG